MDLQERKVHLGTAGNSRNHDSNGSENVTNKTRSRSSHFITISSSQLTWQFKANFAGVEQKRPHSRQKKK